MIKIQELRKRDYKKARQFAIQGIHLYWYVSDKLSLNLYARYFWDVELSRATKAYGAYVDGVETYDKANQEMLRAFCEKNTPDGEIVFLAANPDSKVRGIGTALLSALEKDEHGKLIYLYTDNACTYQFYEHRRFFRAGEQQIILNLEKIEDENGGYYKAVNRMPYCSADFDNAGDWVEYGHTMEDYIGGQIESSFVIEGYCECQLEDIMELHFVTKAVKRV